MISVGIDVSKSKSMVCFLTTAGEVLKAPYEISHTKEDLLKLVKEIQGFGNDVKVVLEATGYYHMPIVQYLHRNGIFVGIINSLVMSKYSKISIRKGKTDKIDALKIASYGIMNWYNIQEYMPENSIYAELRLLSRQYYQYMNIKIKSKTTLLQLCDKTMPNIAPLLENSGYKPEKSKLITFTRIFWHSEKIIEKSESQFVKCYMRWAKREGYHENESKAKKIYAIALSSIPIISCNIVSIKMLMLEAARVLSEVEKTLGNILSQMRDLAKSSIEYSMVRDMKGLGDKLAPRWIAEIGDVRRFKSAKALVAYAGIDSPPYQSGAFTGTQRKISKRGSKYLRKTGYEIMQSITRHKPTEDAAVYNFMLKKESEGKAKKVAKIAGLNKFLHIYYARVKELYENAN